MEIKSSGSRNLFGLENRLFDKLAMMKEEYNLLGIKAEFEAEGSSFRDLVRLRRLTAKLDIPLILKIGGVEAIRDIKDALEVGVDGLVAPMVESRFGLKKFVDACSSIYRDSEIQKAINIETAGGVQNADEILSYAQGRIDEVTFGRTDLSMSYFDDSIYPDSDFIFQRLAELCSIARKYGLSTTMGGSLSLRTIEIMRKNEKMWCDLIQRFETRKVILPAEVMLSDKNAIRSALEFEELYILSKKEVSDVFLEAEMTRLDGLRKRSRP